MKSSRENLWKKWHYKFVELQIERQNYMDNNFTQTDLLAIDVLATSGALGKITGIGDVKGVLLILIAWLVILYSILT